MKNSFRISFIFILLLAFVFSISSVFAAWTYATNPADDELMNVGANLGSFNFDAGAGGGSGMPDGPTGGLDWEYTDWLDPVTSGQFVQYHSFDKNGTDRIYKIEPYTAGGTVPTWRPVYDGRLTFIGWSPIASHDDSVSRYTKTETNDNPPYPVVWDTLYTYRPTAMPDAGVENVTATDTIAVNDIIGFASSTGVIDVYDLYTEYGFTFADAIDISENKDGGNTRDVRFDLYILKNTISSSTPANAKAARLKAWYYGNGKTPHDVTIENEIRYARHSAWDRTLYVHPGIAVWGQSPNSTGTLGYWENRIVISNSNGYDGNYSASDYLYIPAMPKAAAGLLVKQVHHDDPNNNSGSSTCFASGTLVTLANGTQVPVEQLTMQDKLRVFDHENGVYTEANILFIEDEGYDYYNVINCIFSNGKHLKLIYEHGLFDLTTNRYEYITEENYTQFIGHEFAVESDSGYGVTTLTQAYMAEEYIGCYSLPTEYYMNYFIEGMFSVPGGIKGLFNIFEVDENLAYDKQLMAQDIATYGLFSYEDFKDYMSEELYNRIFPIRYLKVAVGKGIVTMEELEAIIQRYVLGHELDTPTDGA